MFTRKLGFKGKKAWRQWCKSGDRPRDIPSCPDKVYRGKGWVSWPDWLGNAFLPFEAARAVARGLGFKRKKEWVEWSKSGDRPDNIPSRPDRTYRGKGWVSWPDWLGYESRRKKRKRL